VRLKKDVKDFRPGLAELKGVRPVSYKYNGLADTKDDGNEFVGVIAQELERVLPSMVRSKKGKLHAGDAEDTDIKIVDPSAFTYVLVNAVQQQEKLIERQEARIATLERGRQPLVSSLVSSHGLLGGLALGLVPFGVFVAQRRRRDQTAPS
jgi:Chaperone of endosialidase